MTNIYENNQTHPHAKLKFNRNDPIPTANKITKYSRNFTVYYDQKSSVHLQ